MKVFGVLAVSILFCNVLCLNNANTRTELHPENAAPKQTAGDKHLPANLDSKNSSVSSEKPSNSSMEKLAVITPETGTTILPTNGNDSNPVISSSTLVPTIIPVTPDTNTTTTHAPPAPAPPAPAPPAPAPPAPAPPAPAPPAPAPPTPAPTPPTPAPTIPTSSTTAPPAPTSAPTSSPVTKASTTKIPQPHPTSVPPAQNRNRFDGPSFIGGIVLSLGLVAIGFIGFKYYKARTERNYRTL